MKGYRLNPDKDYVSKIMEGLYRKKGHCPCKVIQDETTMCPCDQFIYEKICKCNLYVIDKSKENIN